MASVVRRFRRNAAAGQGRSTSTLRLRWTRDVGLPLLEQRFELQGRLSKENYKFYLRRLSDLARWEGGHR